MHTKLDLGVLRKDLRNAIDVSKRVIVYIRTLHIKEQPKIINDLEIIKESFKDWVKKITADLGNVNTESNVNMH